MKTKEEILTEHGCPVIPFDENVKMYYPAILEAMEEYATQQVNLLNKPAVSKCVDVERKISVCVAPAHIKPCRHSFSTICQYNGHCNFKQTDC